MIKLKNTITELKNRKEQFNNRLGETAEKISELELLGPRRRKRKWQKKKKKNLLKEIMIENISNLEKETSRLKRPR